LSNSGTKEKSLINVAGADSSHRRRSTPPKKSSSTAMRLSDAMHSARAAIVATH
jgi:hypothetical protein